MKTIPILLMSFVLSSSCSDGVKDESIKYEDIVGDSLIVTPSNLVFDSKESQQTIVVESFEKEWTFNLLKDDNDDNNSNWCHLSLNESNELVVFVDENKVPDKRAAEVVISTSKVEALVSISQKGAEYQSEIAYPQIESNIPLSALEDEDGNIVPDFSHIGYMGSEKEIPEVRVALTIEPPKNGEDASNLIQNAIDEVSKNPILNGFRGTVLLTKGVYNIKGTINITTSGVVLRGEGEDELNGTVLIASGTTQRSLIKVFGEGEIMPKSTSHFNVKDSYVPVGQFWLRVIDPEKFNVGDNVIVYRPGTKKWIHDLKMDKIPPRVDGGKVVQWNPESYSFLSERVVTHIIGDVLHFDNPIVMALDQNYGGGAVYKYEFRGRLSFCGVENMLMKSEYVSETDENHAWVAVEFEKVEHAWIRNITSKYFGYGLAHLKDGSRYITVKECSCLEAKSKNTGGRRYSFLLDKTQQCLVIDCNTTEGRHDYVTGSKGIGPNAFVRVVAKNAYSDTGPHHRWNIGTLYDNVITDGQINVQDRGSFGTGHGWAGANQVLWNCQADKICVQNPWVSARNYSIGSMGSKHSGANSGRPDGVWIKNNELVTPSSLFDAQLKLRIHTNRLYH